MDGNVDVPVEVEAHGLALLKIADFRDEDVDPSLHDLVGRQQQVLQHCLQEVRGGVAALPARQAGSDI